jgi:hypothetical protein
MPDPRWATYLRDTKAEKLEVKRRGDGNDCRESAHGAAYLHERRPFLLK